MKQFLAIVIVGSSVFLGAQSRQQPSIEWRYWGGDGPEQVFDGGRNHAGQRQPVFSRSLVVHEVGEKPMPEYGMRPGNFENTPL